MMPIDQQPIIKTRAERDVFGINFNKDLKDETIAAVNELVIISRAGADVTDEFRAGEAAPTSADGMVTFWLKAAVADEQAAGGYRIRVIITTNTGRRIESLNASALPQLQVPF